MMRLFLLCVLTIFFTEPFFINAATTPPQAGTSVEWNDEVGDVEAGIPIPGMKPIDVSKVTIRTDGKGLNVSIMLNDVISHYLTNTAGENVLTLFIDADGNDKTGTRMSSDCEIEPFEYIQGFEFKITVYPCLDYGSGQTQCMGAPRRDKVVGYLTNWRLYKYNESNWELVEEQQPKGVPINGKQMDLSVNYSKLNITSGLSVGVSAYENFASGDKGCFPKSSLKVQ